MDEALRFFKANELWIYLILGLGGLIYLRKFIMAWRELRGAIFGLERENAQGRLNQAASVLVLLTIMVIAEFVAVSFVAPMAPGSTPLPTPTLNILATPTSTLELSTELNASAPESSSSTVLPTVQVDNQGCVEGEILITSPLSGAELRGEVEITGTADVPNFGFYKLEYARQDESLWLTIQAGREPKRQQTLVEKWDTSLLSTGDFILQLVIVDSTGRSLPPCRIPVRIVAP